MPTMVVPALENSGMLLVLTNLPAWSHGGLAGELDVVRGALAEGAGG